MKRFFETVCLILLAILLFAIVDNYYENKEEPKEDDPIVETPVEDEVEVLEFTIKYGQGVTQTFQFENGMTWGEWLDSEYATDISNFTLNEDEGYFNYAGNSTNKYYLSDLIEATTYENAI